VAWDEPHVSVGGLFGVGLFWEERLFWVQTYFWERDLFWGKTYFLKERLNFVACATSGKKATCEKKKEK
jgi:hypothetical protein